MPFKSEAQNAWGHTPEGIKALGGVDKVKEWESGTDYSKLPKHVIRDSKKKEVMKKLLKKYEQKVQNKSTSVV